MIDRLTDDNGDHARWLLLPSSTSFVSSFLNIDLIIVVFEKERIQENGRSDEQSFLFDRGFGREMHVKGIGLGKDFGHEGLGLFQNLAQVRRIAVGVGLTGRENPKGHLAATFPATRIALRATLRTRKKSENKIIPVYSEYSE